MASANPSAASNLRQRQATQQRVLDAIKRQQKLSRAKAHCEAELNSLLRRGPAAQSPDDYAALCEQKRRECQMLQAKAEQAATEVGMLSGGVAMLDLHYGFLVRGPGE
ncbi:MAG TPA: hypothetical protein VF194_08180 [Ferrovibrio sp.]|uniref:hypothetical protein n=1 Tax=Ferrovibrio sp. TaxID=1917215 RepID=UPI002ED14B02